MGERGPLEPGAIAPIPGADMRPVPRAPESLEDRLKLEWSDFWKSVVGQCAVETDVPQIRRLFVYRQEHLELSRKYKEIRDDGRLFVEGSRNEGAIQVHPIAKRLDKLEDMMAKIESQYGLTPRSRAQLGIEVGTNALTWSEVAKQQEYSREIEGIKKGIGPSKQKELPVSNVIDIEDS